MTYYDKQIASLNLPQPERYQPTVVIYGLDGSKTKHMSITYAQLEQIRQILNKGVNHEKNNN